MRFEILLGYALLMFGGLSVALGAFVGINIGTDLSNLPSPEQVVAILRSHQITHVRLFDSDNHLLSALSDTGIEVMVSVTNEDVLRIGESPSEAAAWINKNVAAFLPSTNITAIAVGSEVLSAIPNAAPILVPAMKNLHKALISSNLNYKIKVSTPISMDVIPKPFPPSTATFNSTFNTTVSGILKFLKMSDSFFMLNAYPYYGYAQSNGIFPIEYALFQTLSLVKQIVDPNTLFHYESMFDAMVDAAYYAIADYNISVIPIVVTETGWPWLGGANERDANVENAETFNNNLIKRVLNDSGPPSQPTIPMNTYIYELFNEDNRPGAVSEKSYGVYLSNGSSVYTFGLDSLGEATVNGSGGFCVARKGADASSLQDGLNWACGPGQANCSAIQSGQPCYMPDTIENHASFAYNDYYQRTQTVGGTCDFSGSAVATMVDPSYGSCVFTGSTNSSVGGGMVPAAFGPEGPPGSISSHQIPNIWSLFLVPVVLLSV